MPTCSSCGKEVAFVDSSGKGYCHMSDASKEQAKKHLEKIKAEMGIDENGAVNGESQAEFENRMKTFVRELRKAKEEDALEQAEEEGLDVKMGGAGNVSLRPEDIAKENGHGKDGFDSNESMIDSLREQAKQGNKESQKVLDVLWKKTVSAMRENPRKLNGEIQYELSTEEFMEKSSVERLKDAQNKEWRRRNGFVQTE